jgi:hypothetical protein
MTANNVDALIPSDLYKTRFPKSFKTYDLPSFAMKIIETLSCLHEIKMRTDDSDISNKSQELINLLILKYPNLVPQVDNSFPKDSDR